MVCYGRRLESVTECRTIKGCLNKKIKPGSIIVLHDSGDTPWADEEAPLNMITGLEEVLKEMDKKGLKCLRMDELLNKEVSYSREARSRVKHRGQIDL